MKISFIGLGKLGLPLVCCLARSGNQILGVDKNEYILDKLNNDELPFYEPGLTDIFPHDNLIGFTDSYSRAVEEAETSIILVNTQLGDSGYSSEFVESALIDLSVNLKKSKKDYHLIIISSTVLPGSISNLIHLVEKISGRKYGEGFGFAYVPDFVRLGNVIYDFKNPEFFLIGANNQRDISMVQEIWKNFHDNEPPLKILTLEEAEVAKVSLNAFVVNKIAFVNFLGQLCDGMDNVNVHNITDAIGLDKRISPYFFKFGTPYGGTCFPRDSAAFIRFASNRKRDAKNLKFADEVNADLYQSILDKCVAYDKVGIIGISFKPNSPVVIGSPSSKLIQDLIEKNITVFAYDEFDESFSNLNGLEDKIIKCKTPQECVDKSDAIAIMHPDNKFSSLNTSDKFVIDNWGVLDGN